MSARRFEPARTGCFVHRAARHFAACVIGFALLGASDLERLPPPSERAAFAVVARDPYLELRFRGLALKSARQNPGLSEIAFDFAAAVDGELFAELERVVPEWIEFAYAGYDSAVIRTKRPASFTTRPEADGFSLRIEPTDAYGPGASELAAENARLDAMTGHPVRAQASFDGLQREDPRNPYVLRTRAGVEAQLGDWQAAQRYYALALAERPRDENLKRAYDRAQRETGPHVGIGGEWRHVETGETIIAVTASGRLPAFRRLALTAEAKETIADADAVQRLDGTVAPYSDNALSGALGLVYTFTDGFELSGEALAGPNGGGLRGALRRRQASNETEIKTFFGEPYLETAEAIAAKAHRDGAELRHAQRIAKGLWGEAALRVLRYGVDDQRDTARSLGFTASLRFVRELFGWSAGVAYEVEGEYLYEEHPRLDVFGTSFLPLGLRDREVHALSGSMSAPLGEDFWFDSYAGYAYDRYGGNGPFGGLALRYTPLPGFDISLGASHSEVSGRQGEEGATTSAGLNLIYKMPGDPLLGPHD